MSLIKKLMKKLMALTGAIVIVGSMLTGCGVDEDIVQSIADAENSTVMILDSRADQLGLDSEGNKKLTYRINSIDSTFATVTDKPETSSFSLVANAEANAKKTLVLYQFAGNATNYAQIKNLDKLAEQAIVSESHSNVVTYLQELHSFVTANIDNCEVVTNYKDEYKKSDINVTQNDAIVAKVLNTLINREEGIDRTAVEKLLENTKGIDFFKNSYCDLGATVDEKTGEQVYNVKLFAEFESHKFVVDLHIRTEAELPKSEIKSIVTNYLNGGTILHDAKITIGTYTWTNNYHTGVWHRINTIKQAEKNNLASAGV